MRNSKLVRPRARFDALACPRARLGTVLALSVCAAGLLACDSTGGSPARPSTGSPAIPGAGTPGGGAQPGAGAGTTDAGLPALPDIARSTRSSLQWKRHAAFESDLSHALELPKDKLCNEFGKEPCIERVHLSPLGGHNPVSTGLLESPTDPLVTTSAVVERVLLSACVARIEQDRTLGKDAKVFAPLDLAGAAPAPDSAELRTVITNLYRRFLARDPNDEELGIVGSLARDEANAAVSAATFAATACLAVGSSSEFLFF